MDNRRRGAADVPGVAWADLQRHILADVRRRGLRRGQALPSIREIAKAHGVSKALAERAVAGLVEDGVCRAQHGRGVFLAVEGPDAAAEKLAPVLTVGVVFGFQEYPATDHPFYRQVYEGLAEWIAASGSNVLKLYNWRTKGPAQKSRELRQFAGGLGGLVALGIYADQDCILLRDSGLPLVALDYDTEGLGIDSAILDNPGGMLALGRRVAAASPGEVFLVSMERKQPDDPAQDERRAALEAALAETGRSLPSDNLILLSSEEEAAPGQDAARLAPVVRAGREGGARPALVCDDSYILARAAGALAEGGLTVGGDCLVAYIGSTDMTEDLRPWPALVGAYDFREVGRAGARLLEERIGRGPGRAAKVAVPADVIDYQPPAGGG